ncbi:MAG: hypothetical protein K2Q06_14600, partial [Parvularculaceae bacterium]|nr:hypothetical protein [Parvularculaceae bacterium]
RADGAVKVYLPAGEWRRFPTQERYEGGKTWRITLALDEIAVFARAGAEIPLGPAAETTAALDGATIETWTAR